MKRCLTIMLLALSILGTIPAWAASSKLTTNGSGCPAETNTTALVVGLSEDKGGATLTIAGTWTGTISFKATGDGGNTWSTVNVMPLASTTAVTSATANGTWQVNTAGFTGLCMLSSAAMTGSATVTITPSAASARNGGGGGSGTSVTDLTCSAGDFFSAFSTPNFTCSTPSGGSGNTTSTALVSGNLTKANGANSIIDSGISAGNIGTQPTGTGYVFSVPGTPNIYSTSTTSGPKCYPFWSTGNVLGCDSVVTLTKLESYDLFNGLTQGIGPSCNGNVLTTAGTYPTCVIVAGTGTTAVGGTPQYAAWQFSAITNFVDYRFTLPGIPGTSTWGYVANQPITFGFTWAEASDTGAHTRTWSIFEYGCRNPNGGVISPVMIAGVDAAATAIQNSLANSSWVSVVLTPSSSGVGDCEPGYSLFVRIGYSAATATGSANLSRFRIDVPVKVLTQ